MSAKVADARLDVHPQMLRMTLAEDPQKLGEADRRRGIGQIFAAALDHAHITKQQAAGRMGYTDPAVIGKWISGQERVQLDKCVLLGHTFLAEFAAGLVEFQDGVVIERVIRIARTA